MKRTAREPVISTKTPSTFFEICAMYGLMSVVELGTYVVETTVPPSFLQTVAKPPPFSQPSGRSRVTIATRFQCFTLAAQTAPMRAGWSQLRAEAYAFP